jgi:predicted metal-dependent hydrolase
VTTGGAAGRVVQVDGRAKAYRPIPVEQRAAAVKAGLRAYADGDYFLAHERMEPAWMGTADPDERALIQGLIKLAAADVHGVRGNPRGVVQNLDGALVRLRAAADAGQAGPSGLDLPALIRDIECRLELARKGGRTEPIPLLWEP